MSATYHPQWFVQQRRFGAQMAPPSWEMVALKGTTVCLKVLFAHQFATTLFQLFVEKGKYLVMEEVQMDATN